VTLDYALCAALLGVGMVPSALLLLWALRRLLLGGLLAGARATPGSVALFCLFAGLSLFLFYFCGLLVMGAVIRLLSLGVKPGRYRAFSPTMVFWSALNTIHTVAFRLILPLVPGGYFTSMYFRLAGCSLGHDVWITTAALLDPSLISIGDGTVIGGEATISAHIFSNGRLYLAPITIGKDCQVGAHALICAGASIGDGAVVDIRAYVPQGRKVPAGARVTAADGAPPARGGPRSA
jgi:acetyltransferase-like isoleucine patch superfamily enzyme